MTEWKQQFNRELSEQLKQTLWRHNKKPYLPIWGELFILLRQFQKKARADKQGIILYEMEPLGHLRFDFERDGFVADIPEIHLCIQMNMDECIENLIQGRFPPKNPGSSTA